MSNIFGMTYVSACNWLRQTQLASAFLGARYVWNCYKKTTIVWWLAILDETARTGTCLAIFTGQEWEDLETWKPLFDLVSLARGINPEKNQGWSSSTAPDSWLSVGSYQYGLHCRSTANWFGLQCNLHIRRPINRICSSHTYNVKCWRKRSGPIVYQVHLSSPWPEQIHSIGSRP